MCQLRIKSLPKFYICIGLCFWFNFCEEKNIRMKRMKKSHAQCPLTNA